MNGFLVDDLVRKWTRMCETVIGAAGGHRDTWGEGENLFRKISSDLVGLGFYDSSRRNKQGRL